MKDTGYFFDICWGLASIIFLKTQVSILFCPTGDWGDVLDDYWNPFPEDFGNLFSVRPIDLIYPVFIHCSQIENG
jgi:hypothetical protein